MLWVMLAFLSFLVAFVAWVVVVEIFICFDTKKTKIWVFIFIFYFLFYFLEKNQDMGLIHLLKLGKCHDSLLHIDK